MLLENLTADTIIATGSHTHTKPPPVAAEAARTVLSCPGARTDVTRQGANRMEALMIGVSGMRGIVGGTLTPAVVGRMAAAFAVYLKESRPTTDKPLRVVFGRDSRPSGSWVRDAAAASLIASGVELIDLDIVTTPGVRRSENNLRPSRATHAPFQEQRNPRPAHQESPRLCRRPRH